MAISTSKMRLTAALSALIHSTVRDTGRPCGCDCAGVREVGRCTASYGADRRACCRAGLLNDHAGCRALIWTFLGEVGACCESLHGDTFYGALHAGRGHLLRGCRGCDGQATRPACSAPVYALSRHRLHPLVSSLFCPSPPLELLWVHRLAILRHLRSAKLSHRIP